MSYLAESIKGKTKQEQLQSEMITKPKKIQHLTALWQRCNSILPAKGRKKTKQKKQLTSYERKVWRLREGRYGSYVFNKTEKKMKNNKPKRTKFHIRRAGGGGGGFSSSISMVQD